MVERHREPVVVDSCPDCQGVFFDKTELDDVAFLHEGTERRLVYWTRPPEECRICKARTQDSEHCGIPRDIQCGRCGELLTTVRTRSIRAEWCRSCGGILMEAAGVELLAGSFDEAPDPPETSGDPEFHGGRMDWILAAFADFFA